MLNWHFQYSTWRADAPLFGSIRIEDFGTKKWRVNYSVPGFTDRLIDQEFHSVEQAKSAANEFVAAALRKFLYGDEREGS